MSATSATCCSNTTKTHVRWPPIGSTEMVSKTKKHYFAFNSSECIECIRMYFRMYFAINLLAFYNIIKLLFKWHWWNATLISQKTIFTLNVCVTFATHTNMLNQCYCIETHVGKIDLLLNIRTSNMYWNYSRTTNEFNKLN